MKLYKLLVIKTLQAVTKKKKKNTTS